MIGLHQPVVVHNAANRADVNESVKRLPTFPAKAANPTFCGRESERNQKNEPEKAHGDEVALRNIFPHTIQMEGLIGSDVGEEVKANVGESEETEHAAKPNQVGKVKELTEGSD